MKRRKARVRQTRAKTRIGIRIAIKTGKGEADHALVIEGDADLDHAPRAVPGRDQGTCHLYVIFNIKDRLIVYIMEAICIFLKIPLQVS